MSLFDVTATVQLPEKGKATVTFQGRHTGTVELTDDERQQIEDVLIGIVERRDLGRHG